MKEAILFLGINKLIFF